MGYFKFLDDLVKSSNAAGKDLAVFFLTYTLAPHARYPTQLTQAVEALRYVVTQTDHQPSQVLLGGDSAGGNLAMGVLSHASHPHQAIDPLTLSEPLAGVALIAPWVSFDDYREESPIDIGDIVTSDVSIPWSKAYLGTATRDYYTDVFTAPPEWTKDFPTKQILVLGGENEIMMPLLQHWVDLLKVWWLLFPLSPFPSPGFGTDELNSNRWDSLRSNFTQERERRM